MNVNIFLKTSTNKLILLMSLKFTASRRALGMCSRGVAQLSSSQHNLDFFPKAFENRNDLRLNRRM